MVFKVETRQHGLLAAFRSSSTPSEVWKEGLFKGAIAVCFDDDAAATEPRWAKINTTGGRVENLRQFGGTWLKLHLIRTLQVDSPVERTPPDGRERVNWDGSSLILVIARLLEPSSELYAAEQWYPKTAIPDLLRLPEEGLDDNRPYLAMDALLSYQSGP